MSDRELLAELIGELRKLIDLDGFGCACEPKVQCSTCKARSIYWKGLAPLVTKYGAALSTPGEAR